MEINFCRRCGQKLTQKTPSMYECLQGHQLFYTSVPAATLFLVNDRREVMLVTRAVEPAKGQLDAPGGFCDAGETFEQAVRREIKEEIGLSPADYGEVSYLVSVLDDYPWQGAVNKVLSVMFWAYIKTTKPIHASDDVASIVWYSLDKDIPELPFNCVRDGLRELKTRL